MAAVQVGVGYRNVIQVSKAKAGSMRYELSDGE